MEKGDQHSKVLTFLNLKKNTEKTETTNIILCICSLP